MCISISIWYFLNACYIVWYNSCIGVEVDVLNDVESAENCLKLCQDEDDCQWATYLVRNYKQFRFLNTRSVKVGRARGLHSD